MSSEATLDTSRIDYLIAQSDVASLRVVVVGVGSGGAVVVERLAMCGIRSWALFDPDLLEPVNLVKHPARRSDLFRPKVEITAEWLRDRNPRADVRAYQADVVGLQTFDDEIANADLVVCAVDNAAARSYINHLCVAARLPCVFGSVFRTGLGGEVYAYLPGETGCHDCKLRYVAEQGTDLDNLLELTQEETHHIYGLGEGDFAASGLAVDIGIVATMHAHYIMSLFGAKGSAYLTAPSFNWLTIGLRDVPDLFSVYQCFRMKLRGRHDCLHECGAGYRKGAG
ncbi:ThiF family adenylyltransferase [Phytohabitans kaempferiae]|uniref:ThiF family adenylyltransferase n=1 Tax=Phytohabitans kaempferiae TaxID=1620943 RepID=A0ABV6MFS0_9ACTN